MSETDKIIAGISEVVVDKIDDLRTTLRGEIAELRAEMNERFDHLAKAVDVVAVRVAQLTNGDHWRK